MGGLALFDATFEVELGLGVRSSSGSSTTTEWPWARSGSVLNQLVKLGRSGSGTCAWMRSTNAKGYGRETMALAEVEARNQGLQSWGLNVYGHNQIARHLYESMGYTTTAIRMKKNL